MLPPSLRASTAPHPSESSCRGGPSAVLLHGAGAWGGQWAIWRRVLAAEGWAVATPDRQPVAAGWAATRFEDYVEQTVVAMQQLPEAPVLLVGASLGGLLALAVNGRLPPDRRPRAMVLINPLPSAPAAAGLPPFDSSSALVPWHAEGRFASTRRALPQASFRDQQWAFRGWRDESARVLRDAYAGMHVPPPDVPTLVIASEEDRDVPLAVSMAHADALGATLCRLPGGHVAPVMGESAVAAARAALDWVRPRLSRP